MWEKGGVHGANKNHPLTFALSRAGRGEGSVLEIELLVVAVVAVPHDDRHRVHVDVHALVVVERAHAAPRRDDRGGGAVAAAGVAVAAGVLAGSGRARHRLGAADAGGETGDGVAARDTLASAGRRGRDGSRVAIVEEKLLCADERPEGVSSCSFICYSYEGSSRKISVRLLPSWQPPKYRLPLPVW